MKDKTLFANCLSIIGGALIIGGCIFTGIALANKPEAKKSQTQDSQYRYEMLTNENHLIVFDKQTGEYWDRAIDKNAAPTDWRKMPSPVATVK